MAGTVTRSELTQGKLDKVMFTWASSTTGAADDTTSALYLGQIVQVLVIPGGTTPTDQFDVVLQNPDGVDLLFGQGANCSNTDTTVIENGGHVVNEALTLGITNAGSEKTGSVIVYVKE